ncbi:50S ribosomal protein L18 [bacterium HR34]|nr:50S ribosomal protein L18 [bacterium HR34]
MNIKEKIEKRKRRIKRVRSKIIGTKERPRLYVFKSNKYVYAGLAIDLEDTSKTLFYISTKDIKNNKKPLEKALELGKIVGEKARQIGIDKVVFDRRGYKYHGIVKNIAEGARQVGLKF